MMKSLSEINKAENNNIQYDNAQFSKSDLLPQDPAYLHKMYIDPESKIILNEPNNKQYFICKMCYYIIFDPVNCDDCKNNFCLACILDKDKLERYKKTDILQCDHFNLRDLPLDKQILFEKIKMSRCYFDCNTPDLNLFTYPEHTRQCEVENNKNIDALAQYRNHKDIVIEKIENEQEIAKTEKSVEIDKEKLEEIHRKRELAEKQNKCYILANTQINQTLESAKAELNMYKDGIVTVVIQICESKLEQECQKLLLGRLVAENRENKKILEEIKSSYVKKSANVTEGTTVKMSVFLELQKLYKTSINDWNNKTENYKNEEKEWIKKIADKKQEIKESLEEEARIKHIFNDLTLLNQKIDILLREVKEQTLEGHSETILCMFRLSNTQLVTGSQDKTIRIWNIFDSVCENTLEGHTGDVVCMIKLNDNLFASASSDNTVKIWDFYRLICTETYSESQNPILSIARLSNITLASSSMDLNLRVYNFYTKAVIVTIPLTYLINCFVSLDNLDDLANKNKSKSFFLGCNDSTIKLWDGDTSSDKEIKVKNIEGHTDQVTCIINIKDNLVSGSNNGIIKLWNLTNYACKQTLIGHNQTVYCVSSIMKNVIASSSKDCTIRLWKVDKGECLLTVDMKEAIYAVNTIIELKLVSGGSDKVLKIRNLKLE